MKKGKSMEIEAYNKMKQLLKKHCLYYMKGNCEILEMECPQLHAHAQEPICRYLLYYILTEDEFKEIKQALLK